MLLIKRAFQWSVKATFLAKFSISAVGPSLDPSGINFVDTIQIYVKSKESFMWPEHTPLPAPATKTPHDGPSPTAQGDGEQGSEVMPMVLNKDCSVVDRCVNSSGLVQGRLVLYQVLVDDPREERYLK